MTHPTDDSLKPCPFCGGAATLFPRTCDKNTPYNPADRAFPVARCGQCGAEAVGKDWGRPETAAAAWNRRVLLAAQPAVQQPAENAPSDAMVDAYLTAQRAAVEEADRFGRPNAGGLHTNTVREACRAGLAAAIKAQGGKQ